MLKCMSLHCSLTYNALTITTIRDQLARFAFDRVYVPHVIQAIYQALLTIVQHQIQPASLAAVHL